jgi:transcriptional regulatory protein RtcR
LRERAEDIEPNLDYELERLSVELGFRVSFARPARDAFLRFALAAPWRGNFRDFNAALRRMATLAGGGRIDAARRHRRARPPLGSPPPRCIVSRRPSTAPRTDHAPEDHLLPLPLPLPLPRAARGACARANPHAA